MSNRRYKQFYYTFHKKPVQLDLNFIVDSTNGNGMGIRSLKGQGIASVFMNTSASFTATYNNSVNLTGIPGGTSALSIGMPVQGTGIPAGAIIASIVSSSAITISLATTGGAHTGSVTYQAPGNPNPGAGIIIVNLQDCYNRYLYGSAGFGSPVSGTPLTSVTANSTYVIVSVGSTTLAQWQAVGLPKGITPAVGVVFIASSTGAIGGSGAVEASIFSGVDHVELLGDPNQTIISNAGSQAVILGQASGAYIVSQCYFEGTPTAPVNGTVIGMSILLSSSSQSATGGE